MVNQLKPKTKTETVYCYKCIKPLSEPYAPNIGKKMPQSAGAETSPRTSRSLSANPWPGCVPCLELLRLLGLARAGRSQSYFADS